MFTITMGALKEALYSDMAKDFVGEVICVDLGVSFKRYTQGFNGRYISIRRERFSFHQIETFSKNTHKGIFDT